MHDTRTIRRRKLWLASGLSALGAGLLVLLAFTHDFPDNVALWAAFAVAFIVLEWRAVEVNHHLFVSSSIMVALTAAAIFGPGEAPLAVAAMAALALITPADLRRRHWFEPLANFGQLVITTAVAVSVLEVLHPGDVTPQNVWRLAVAAALAAVVYGVVNFNLVAFVVRRVYGRQLVPWSRLGAALVPYLGMGFVGGLLGAAYLLVGAETLPLIAAVFFVGHLSFASYGQLREAQEATLRGFVKALEAKDLYTTPGAIQSGSPTSARSSVRKWVTTPTVKNDCAGRHSSTTSASWRFPAI